MTLTEQNDRTNVYWRASERLLETLTSREFISADTERAHFYHLLLEMLAIDTLVRESMKLLHRYFNILKKDSTTSGNSAGADDNDDVPDGTEDKEGLTSQLVIISSRISVIELEIAMLESTANDARLAKLGSNDPSSPGLMQAWAMGGMSALLKVLSGSSAEEHALEFPIDSMFQNHVCSSIRQEAMELRTSVSAATVCHLSAIANAMGISHVHALGGHILRVVIWDLLSGNSGTGKSAPMANTGALTWIFRGLLLDASSFWQNIQSNTSDASGEISDVQSKLSKKHVGAVVLVSQLGVSGVSDTWQGVYEEISTTKCNSEGHEQTKKDVDVHSNFLVLYDELEDLTASLLDSRKAVAKIETLYNAPPVAQRRTATGGNTVAHYPSLAILSAGHGYSVSQMYKEKESTGPEKKPRLVDSGLTARFTVTPVHAQQSLEHSLVSAKSERHPTYLFSLAVSIVSNVDVGRCIQFSKRTFAEQISGGPLDSATKKSKYFLCYVVNRFTSLLPNLTAGSSGSSSSSYSGSASTSSVIEVNVGTGESPGIGLHLGSGRGGVNGGQHANLNMRGAIVPNGKAANAGVNGQYVLVSVNDTPVGNAASFCSVIAFLSAFGDSSGVLAKYEAEGEGWDSEVDAGGSSGGGGGGGGSGVGDCGVGANRAAGWVDPYENGFSIKVAPAASMVEKRGLEKNFVVLCGDELVDVELDSHDGGRGCHFGVVVSSATLSAQDKGVSTGFELVAVVHRGEETLLSDNSLVGVEWARQILSLNEKDDTFKFLPQLPKLVLRFRMVSEEYAHLQLFHDRCSQLSNELARSKYFEKQWCKAMRLKLAKLSGQLARHAAVFRAGRLADMLVRYCLDQGTLDVSSPVPNLGHVTALLDAWIHVCDIVGTAPKKVMVGTPQEATLPECLVLGIEVCDIASGIARVEHEMVALIHICLQSSSDALSEILKSPLATRKSSSPLTSSQVANYEAVLSTPSGGIFISAAHACDRRKAGTTLPKANGQPMVDFGKTMQRFGLIKGVHAHQQGPALSTIRIWFECIDYEKLGPEEKSKFEGLLTKYASMSISAYVSARDTAVPTKSNCSNTKQKQYAGFMWQGPCCDPHPGEYNGWHCEKNPINLGLQDVKSLKRPLVFSDDTGSHNEEQPLQTDRRMGTDGLSDEVS